MSGITKRMTPVSFGQDRYPPVNAHSLSSVKSPLRIEPCFLQSHILKNRGFSMISSVWPDSLSAMLRTPPSIAGSQFAPAGLHRLRQPELFSPAGSPLQREVAFSENHAIRDSTFNGRRCIWLMMSVRKAGEANRHILEQLTTFGICELFSNKFGVQRPPTKRDRLCPNFNVSILCL
jgi:hypothetical protein